MNTCMQRGLQVNNILFDDEFESLCVPFGILGLKSDIVSIGKHVPRFERMIQNLNYHCRYT